MHPSSNSGGQGEGPFGGSGSYRGERNKRTRTPCALPGLPPKPQTALRHRAAMMVCLYGGACVWLRFCVRAFTPPRVGPTDM